MGFEVSFGKARCEARYDVSGEQRNAADEPSKPTEGRVLSRLGCVAALIRCGGIRCTTSHYEPRLVRTENLPGQMIPCDRNMLLA